VIQLIRVPSERHQAQQECASARPGYVPYRVAKYDYMTPDSRWLVQQNGGCGGGWKVIDTTGEYVCTSCARNSEGHTTIVQTLAAAKAFITEWSV
jgi:hypothetical protein